MKIRYFILAFLGTLILVANSCKRSTKQIFIAHSKDTIKVFKLPIGILKREFKNYHGKFIETNGIFHSGFEDCSLSSSNDFNSNYRQMFWLNISEELNIDLPSYSKLNGKNIKIRGKIDTASRGHLSQYLATIRQIYCIEEQ
jgi:hypothetical protein